MTQSTRPRDAPKAAALSRRAGEIVHRDGLSRDILGLDGSKRERDHFERAVIQCRIIGEILDIADIAAKGDEATGVRLLSDLRELFDADAGGTLFSECCSCRALNSLRDPGPSARGLVGRPAAKHATARSDEGAFRGICSAGSSFVRSCIGVSHNCRSNVAATLAVHVRRD